MEEKKNESKLPYEDLERVALQLNAQVQNLSERLMEERNNNVWGRLSFLFECVSHAEVFGDSEFIAKCCKEIKEKLYPETFEK